jgi:hypothetical protein
VSCAAPSPADSRCLSLRDMRSGRDSTTTCGGWPMRAASATCWSGFTRVGGKEHRVVASTSTTGVPPFRRTRSSHVGRRHFLLMTATPHARLPSCRRARCPTLSGYPYTAWRSRRCQRRRQ